MNKSSEAASSGGLHVAMFPFFAFGHISPFVQLSNKLSLLGVKVSFLSAPGNVKRINSMLNPSPTTQVVPLSFPRVEGLPPGLESTADLSPEQSQLLRVALDLMQPQIKTVLSELKPHFLLFDFAQQWIPSLASELGIKTIFFSVFLALPTAFLTVPSRLPPAQPKRPPTLQELKKPPPGFPPTSVTSVPSFVARDFLYVFQSFHGKPSVYEAVVQGITGCDFILAKTCNEMEAPYIDYVKDQFKKPFFLIGPVVPEPRSEDFLEDRWTKWLGQFSANSVIYCSFGSETFLDDDQIEELLLGLDLTGQPFFVVLNFPAARVDALAELKRGLPEGFLERVKDRAVIHSGWVQQQKILAHASVGCYLCHAGFSSVVEAMVNDCQVVMLPQKGDQFMNSKLVSGDLEAGVEVNRRDEDGYFGKMDIAEAVKTVMMNVDEEPAKSIRENHKKWKEFLKNSAIQENFVKNFVKEMEAVAEPRCI